MKEIIKKGKKLIKNRHIYIIKCPVCDCIFKCEDADLEPIESGRSYAVQCPCCGEYTKNRSDIIDMRTVYIFEK